METFNFFSKYDNIDIPIQIIKLKDSLFVYIGTPSLLFKNLNVAHPDNIEVKDF